MEVGVHVVEVRVGVGVGCGRGGGGGGGGGGVGVAVESGGGVEGSPRILSEGLPHISISARASTAAR